MTKTFADLVFMPHAHAIVAKEPGAEIAKMTFPGDRWISVIRGSKRFQSGQGTYEVMVHDGMLSEVRGYQTSAQITEIMKSLQGDL